VWLPCSSRGGALRPGALLQGVGEVEAPCRDAATPVPPPSASSCVASMGGGGEAGGGRAGRAAAHAPARTRGEGQGEGAAARSGEWVRQRDRRPARLA
jgi:hypothetical protein